MVTPIPWQIPSARLGRRNPHPPNDRLVPIQARCAWQTQKSRLSLRLFARVYLGSLCRQYLHAARFRVDCPHVFPVIRKLLATTQTHKIRSSNGRDDRPWLALAASNDRSTSFVPTTEDPGPGHLKQFNDHRHLLWGEPRRVTMPTSTQQLIGDGETPL
jgi:hypothetical protein